VDNRLGSARYASSGAIAGAAPATVGKICERYLHKGRAVWQAGPHAPAETQRPVVLQCCGRTVGRRTRNRLLGAAVHPNLPAVRGAQRQSCGVAAGQRQHPAHRATGGDLRPGRRGPHDSCQCQGVIAVPCSAYREVRRRLLVRPGYSWPLRLPRPKFRWVQVREDLTSPQNGPDCKRGTTGKQRLHIDK
jgi:hypothetical protein